MSKILIKVTNGSKIYIENVSYLLSEDVDKFWYRQIKIKETDLERYKDHFIYEWSEGFYESISIPDWVLKSQLLEFEIIHE
jgi:hypothetical protein